FDLHAEIALVPVQTDGRTVEKFLVDVFLPEIARLNDVHVGIHRFKTVLHGFISWSVHRLTEGRTAVNLAPRLWFSLIFRLRVGAGLVPALRPGNHKGCPYESRPTEPRLKLSVTDPLLPRVSGG